MTTVNLKSLFAPNSVALISNDSQTSKRLIRNLVDGGFAGSIMPVTGRRGTLEGLRTHASLDGLKQNPDLAVVSLPLARCPAVITNMAAGFRVDRFN